MGRNARHPRQQSAVLGNGVATRDINLDGNVLDFATRVGFGAVSKTFAFGDMTDGGALAGHIDFADDIPDGAVVILAALHTLVGFTGGANSSAVITLGDDAAADADRYNTGTPNVFVTNASGVALGVPSGTKWHDAAITPRAVITVDNDFSTVDAGSCTIAILYICP